MNNVYTYKEHQYTCDNCGWSGKGEVLKQGDLYEEGFEVNCPECKELLELVVFPTIEEVLKFGTGEEKKQAREEMEFWEQWQAMSLKSADELPEIAGDDLVFEVEERKYKKKEFLFLLYDGKEIWKEPLLYEYYERFIDIGKVLQEKYGNRMKDLVPPDNRSSLYGDRLSSIDRVKEFRKSLKDKRN